MYRFFVNPEETRGETITITGEDVNHIRNVLRMKPGEEILISDGREREYRCNIEQMDESWITARIVDVEGSSRELPVKITLFQGLPKSDKMELIIQKAVELGVHEIVPVATKRAVVKLDPKKEAKKRERWNAIALSAAKQSKRTIIPVVKPVLSYQEALSCAKALSMNLMPYEDAQGIAHSRQLIQTVTGKESLGIFIGPEGGFEEAEVEAALAQNIQPITLGHRILRTETAGMAVLSILMFALEQD